MMVPPIFAPEANDASALDLIGARHFISPHPILVDSLIGKDAFA